MLKTQETPLGDISWERIVRAVERVRQRLNKVVATLKQAGIPYAIVGGNAVASWISRIDESLARNTRDVDVLLDRSDFPAAREALEAVGFTHIHSFGVDIFRDDVTTKLGESVHIVFAGEKVKPGDAVPTPSIVESEESAGMRIVSFEGLVKMKLVANRDRDRTHIRDLIGAGMIDESWCDRLPAPLADRLRYFFENPE